MGEKLLGEGAGGDTGGRFACAGPFEHAADAAQVFQRPGEVAVARAGTGEFLHALQLVVAVGDLQGDGAAERDALPDTAADVDRVGLDPLPAAAAVTALAAFEFDVDQPGVDLDPGREPVYECQEALSVGFTGGPVTQHVFFLGRGLRERGRGRLPAVVGAGKSCILHWSDRVG